MITAVCLNPAIDKSAVVDHLQPTKVNRLRDMYTVIGGKGINVAIVLKRLQAVVCCLGIIGEADERFFAQSMEQVGVRFQGIRVPGNVRCNLKIVDSSTLAVTEFNEQGAEVNAAALDELTQELRENAKNSSYIALCGSLPPGCNVDTYQKLMQTAPDKRWVVDTSGEAMRYALREKPFLIKPNLAELEELAQTRLTTQEAIKETAVNLCKLGTAYVAVSLGKDGAILTNGEKTVFAPAIPVTAKSTVGAGDAMLAGILFGLERGETVFQTMRYGIAAGAACVQGGNIHSFSEQDFAILLSKVETYEI